MEIFRVENLSFSYPDADKKALSEVSFCVNKGEFVVLCSKSGGGKTTLLRQLKPELTPFGEKSGEIYFNGAKLSKDNSSEIGFVLQNPETQVVTDKVISELAFGLENYGVEPSEIRRRIAEMSSFFGIDSWISKQTSQLSGGQKQILSLASVMVMRPQVIILDEPSSQLDPVSTENFFNTLRRINQQFATTIILSEHRLEECFSMADKVLYLEEGRLVLNAKPEIACKELYKTDMRVALPSASKIFGGETFLEKLPLTVREGREIILSGYKKTEAKLVEREISSENAVLIKDLWFRYEKNTPDILKGVELEVKKGEICCVLGGNGAGKTTLLNVISKLSKAYHGTVKLFGKKITDFKGNSIYKGTVGVLPQNPKNLFSSKTVREDFVESCKALGKNEEIIEEIAVKLSFENLLDRHPLDLSGGEIQKCALGRVLISDPEILLLDEATKGLDAFSKKEIGGILKSLSESGKTIVFVTHDTEFSAEFADSCCLLFDGEIVSKDIPQRFFSQNYFYTTSSASISRDVVKNAVTPSQVAENLIRI